MVQLIKIIHKEVKFIRRVETNIYLDKIRIIKYFIQKKVIKLTQDFINHHLN
jgi:hypothetical protein